MTAAVVDLALEQGATKTFSILWGSDDGAGGIDPYDLVGCTAEMMIRQTVTSAPAALTATSILDGGITIEPAGEKGRIEVVLTDEKTDAIGFPKGVWDLEVTHPDGSVSRVVQGAVTISPSVTHPDPARAARPLTPDNYPHVTTWPMSASAMP